MFFVSHSTKFYFNGNNINDIKCINYKQFYKQLTSCLKVMGLITLYFHKLVYKIFKLRLIISEQFVKHLQNNFSNFPLYKDTNITITIKQSKVKARPGFSLSHFSPEMSEVHVYCINSYKAIQKSQFILLNDNELANFSR